MTVAAFAPMTADYDLTGAFDLAPGYYSPCWLERAGRVFVPDRKIVEPLTDFIGQVSGIANASSLSEPVGDAFLRVIDAEYPCPRMRWHVDNDEHGVRFTTAIASDGWPVNMAFLDDERFVGDPVDVSHPYTQYPNGHTCVFRREPHGALPTVVRPGARTAVFFATLYPSRRVADLHTDNGGNGSVHRALPALESTRAA